MADEADRAQVEIERAEKRLMDRVRAARESAINTTECAECGIEKPPARHDKTYCIDCQLRFEKKERGL